MSDPNKPQHYSLGRIPHPYKAMLAICSDLDETPDIQTYVEIARYLNSGDKTRIGTGLGLEVGNTIYFKMPEGQFSFWNTDDTGRRVILDLIGSGHIDCLHSFGDLATTRADAMQAIESLSRHGAALKVWIDHAVAPSNLGADIMRGHGDLRDSDAYHADLTHDYGIRYVWLGRVTSIIGQNCLPSLTGISNFRYAQASMQTISKEMMKIALGLCGSKKYAMHGNNRVMRKTCLRDGRQVNEFMRCNPHWGGISVGDNADGIASVLTPRFFETLIRRKGYSILYTHLGKITDRDRLFNMATRKAFRLLKEYSNREKILVTTTRRLLDYCRMLDTAEIRYFPKNNNGVFDVTSDMSLDEMDGLTIVSDDADKAELRVNGRIVDKVLRIQGDKNRCGMLCIPWRKLQFPPITNPERHM